MLRRAYFVAAIALLSACNRETQGGLLDQSASPVDMASCPGQGCPGDAAMGSDAGGQFCGGFAGLPCPEGYSCADDPSDDCDPQKGGADCSGICVVCGQLHGACCANDACLMLECCAGVPYPPEGRCEVSCELASDRFLKEGLASISPADVLERLARLPMSSWSYKADGSAVRHVGPMAQDFYAAFGLGASDKRIDMVDANGINVAAIQALYRDVQALRRENATLRARLDAYGRSKRTR